MLKAVKYELSEVPQRYWDLAHKYGTIYQSQSYLGFLAAMGRELLIIAVEDEDRIIGGAGIMMNHKILNFAYSAYIGMGPVVEDAKRTVDVLECLADALKSSCLSFNVRVWPLYPENIADDLDMSRWSAQEFELLHWDISGPLESFWKELPKGKKAAIKRARREGIIIEEIETPEQVEQFYDLHTMSMTRADFKKPHPLAFYKNLIARLKPERLATGFLALHPQTKQPIAAVMLLLGRDGMATYLQVGHDYEYRNLGATDLLMWHCLEFLKSKGFTTFDLVGLPKGDSARAQGIRHYKLVWAGANGRRCPLVVLSRANFGTCTKAIRKVALVWKKLIKSIMKCALRGKSLREK
jgi:lipid II:glycine glycyltransferase (peptidoglycan interpeptide bridge formation enzyme)